MPWWMWVLSYVLAGVGTVALATWLNPDFYEDFDGGPLMIATTLFWPLGILLIGLNELREVIAEASRQSIRRAQEARRELEAAEREVEYMLTGKRRY